jgi:hypothetical protein
MERRSCLFNWNLVCTILELSTIAFSNFACGDAAPANNTSSNRPANSRPANQTNTSNSASNTTSNSYSNSQSGPSNSLGTNSGANDRPPPTQTAEKRDEGLFSFPPPKVISYALIPSADIADASGTTPFSQVSEKLASGLDEAGYSSDRYAFFWNETDEFAVVTAMERINEDGKPLDEPDRWNVSTSLPRARDAGEYTRYLFSGKKVFYRVLAFVVTSRRSGKSFNRNSPPDFVMAKNWMNKGEPELGDGESSTIQNVFFTNRYRCYALLYLFVNHTSLDNPTSVDLLKEGDETLIEGLNLKAEDHLRNSNVKFGGQNP